MENDPQCGLVTGGREECYWDCYNQDLLALQIATNIQCIVDCIPAQCEEISSVSSIVEGIGANEVCEGSLLHQLLEFRNINISTRACEYFLGIPYFLTEGTCSLTLSSLAEIPGLTECLGAVLTLPPVVVDTIFAFLSSSCSVKLPEPILPSTGAECYSTCEFITVNGFQTNIVDNIQCLRGCFDSPEILTFYDRIQTEGVCQWSPVQFLKANITGGNETSCVFPDISADTTDVLENLVMIYTSLIQLPYTLFVCALQVLLRGGVLGSLSVCSSLFRFSLVSPSSLQLGARLMSLPAFVLQSNLVWFLSSSVFSSLTSLIFATYQQGLPFNATDLQTEALLGFISDNSVCFINPSQGAELAFSDVLDCLGLADSFPAQFSSSLCEDSLLHLGFLALNISVQTRPCSYYLGLPFMPIQGTCNSSSSFSLNTTNASPQSSPLAVFALTIAWWFNSCSFGLPAASIFSPATPSSGISITDNITFPIDLTYISSCLQGDMLAEIFANLTTNFVQRNVPLQESDAEFLRRELTQSARTARSARLPPIVSATELGGTRLEFENTKHRYSWICSLRRKVGKQHLCAVTLLSRPPKPTVIVGAAHCTYLCKNSEDQILPNCCCSGGGEGGGAGSLDCSSDLTKCPGRAAVVEMTGEDAEILCGEWQTGDLPPEQSQERFNILLPIISIIRHPDYTIGNNK